MARRRSRRVSFADTTAVHVFDRDEDYEETPPDERPASPSPSPGRPLAGYASEGNETEGEEESPFDFLGDVDGCSSSPGSVAGSISSIDGGNLSFRFCRILCVRVRVRISLFDLITSPHLPYCKCCTLVNLAVISRLRMLHLSSQFSDYLCLFIRGSSPHFKCSSQWCMLRPAFTLRSSIDKQFHLLLSHVSFAYVSGSVGMS